MKRSYGIDCYRILVMSMVVILHIIGHGGMLSGVDNFSGDYYIINTLKIMCFMAVDGFALISGYLLYEKKTSLKKLMFLWLEVVFYSILIDFIGGLVLEKNVLSIKSLFPIMTYKWWYITAYFGLLLFVPIINNALKHLDEKSIKMFCFSTLFLFSIIPTFLGANPFNLENGYSTLWLIVLYIYGATINKYNILDKLSNRWIYILLSVLLIGTVLSKVLLQRMFGLENGEPLVLYTSPTILCLAILSLERFGRLKVKSNRMIEFLSKYSLAVYLISDHPLLRENIMPLVADSCKQFPFFVNACAVIIFAVLIFIICCLIDFVREKMFCVFRINKVALKGMDMLDKFLNQFAIRFGL